jgi:hypothetical protein
MSLSAKARIWATNVLNTISAKSRVRAGQTLIQVSSKSRIGRKRIYTIDH